MIALNETNEYAAEVAFTLPLATDPLTGLTGWTFTIGEVQLKLPGGTWFDVPVNKIVEKGYGRFAVQLTSSQTVTAGDVYIKVIVDDTQPYYGSDVIGVLGGDIPQNDTGSINFFLPDEINPVYGTPLTGHTFTAGEVKICLPDSAYADVDVSTIEEVGFGLYRVNLSASQTAKRGKVFVYASVSGYQRFEGYGTILGTGVAEAPVVVTPTPVAVPVSVTSPQSTYIDLITKGVNRMCEYSKSGDFEAGEFIDNVGLDAGLDLGVA